MANEHTVSHTQIPYRLALTTVRITGTKRTVSNSLGKPTRWQGDGAVEITLVADPSERFELKADATTAWGDRSTSLTLLPDGRLGSAGGSVKDRSGSGLKAVLTVGGFAAGTALALGAAPLSAAGVAVVAGAAALAAAGQQGGPAGQPGALQKHSAPPTTTPTAPPEPSDQDLGIHEQYEDEHPADHGLLRSYRIASFVLTARHVAEAQSQADPITMAKTLRALGRSLDSVRAEAAPSEARYAAWVASKETTKEEHVDVAIDIWSVPNEDALRTAIATHDDGKSHSASRQKWWPAAHDLGTMISLDYLDGQDPPPQQSSLAPSAVPPGHVVYRTPRPVVMATWRVERKADSTGFELHLERRDRMLVTAPGTERAVPVVAGSKTATTALGIDPSGALVKLDVSATGASADRADDLAAAPDLFAGGLTSGSTVGTSFSPAAIEALRLKQQVEIAENRAKLTSTPDPEPIKGLKEQLAVTELEARLQVSKHLRDHPSEATVIFQRGES